MTDENQKQLENKGYFFKNKRKSQERQPDWTGKVNFKGQEIALAAWEKTNQAGEKFLSISASEPYKPENGANGGEPGAKSGYNNGGAASSGGYSNQGNKSSSFYGKKPDSTAAHPDNSLDELNSLFDPEP